MQQLPKAFRRTVPIVPVLAFDAVPGINDDETNDFRLGIDRIDLVLLQQPPLGGSQAAE